MGLCVYNDKSYLRREKHLNDVYDYWNSFSSIKKSIGEATESLSQESINIMSENLFKGRPMSMDVDFSDGEIRRMKTAIRDLNGRITKGNMGNLRLNMTVGESISMKHPLGRSFYETINSATNFERNYQDRAFYDVKNISEALLDAVVKTGDAGFRDKLRNAQNRYFKESARDNSDAAEKAMSDIKYEIEDLVNNNQGGRIFRDYKELVGLDHNAFKKEVKNPKYDKDVRNAAETSRTLLEDLGKKVVIPGLNNLYEAAVRKIHHGDMPKLPDKSLIHFKKKVVAAQDRVLKAIKRGGYFPQVMLEDLMRVNSALQNDLLSSKGGIESTGSIRTLGESIDTMMPDRLKAKTPLSEQMWNNDPIEVLNGYAKDVIAFNKINHIAASYLKIMPKLADPGIDSKFIDGMRQFVDDQFQISSRGFKDRPAWVNDISRTLLSAYTLKTMGLSTTGALRNTLSAAYFFGGIGMFNAANAYGAYKSGKKFGGDAESITDIVGRVEKDQGFHFLQAETFTEMVADGLITSSADKNSITFDPVNNRISYKDQGAWQHVDDAMRWMTSKSLTMHRWGENITRTALFRTAFVQSYEVLSKTDLPRNVREQKATNFALRTVNQFAFEYAPHSKARMVGGRPASGPVDPKTGKPTMTGKDYAAAGGQLMFQFLHFPQSFLQNQARVIRGGIDGIRSRQLDAPEYQVALNFAGIYAATQALSIAFNVDLNNIMENDSVERVKDMAGHLTDDPDLEGRKRGLLAQFMGPIPSDIMFWLNTNALNQSDPSKFREMMLGDIDYDDPVNMQNAKRYKISTEYGRWTNKILPEFGNGNGWNAMWRHIFAAYPRDWTREYNKRLMKWMGIRKPSNFKRKATHKDRTMRSLQRLSRDIKKGSV